MTEPSTDARYEALIAANAEVAENIPPKKRKRKGIIFETPDLIHARNNIKSCTIKNQMKSTMSTRANIQSVKESRDKAYSKELDQHISTKTAPIERLLAERQSAKAWETIRELTNKKSSTLSKVKGDTNEGQLKTWYDHFKSLLGPEPPDVDISDDYFNRKISNHLPIDIGQFTMKELDNCLSKLTKSKVPGPDNIPAIIWKHLIFKNELLTFCNEALNESLPSAFSKSSMFATPEKEDLKLPSNYRGITLTAISAKIYNSLLLNRISEHTEPILRQNQNGFRKGRSTLPQILALRGIIEEIRTSSRNATLVFIDFSKAFDSVNRKTMLHILSMYCIPEKIIAAIKRMYENPPTFLDIADGPTDIFSTTTGILQGDTLAPCLLVIIVDYILRQSVDNISNKGLLVTPRRSTRHPSKYITDLDYADDIALTSDNLENALSLLHLLERAANRVSLHMNCNKTENVLVKDCEHKEVKSLNGNILKQVNDFKYLGSYISSSKKYFKIRKAQA